MLPSSEAMMQCMFCTTDLDFLSVSEREAHYEHHLLNDLDKPGEGSQTKPIILDSITDASKVLGYRSDASATSSKKITFPCMNETDVFWYAAQDKPPPSSFTPGLVPFLRKGLIKAHARGSIRKAALCYDNAVHVNRESWDASWGCGYRNFLMACAGLMTQEKQPLYFPLLDSPISPGIRNLQVWIEAAWGAGFDHEGREELKKLIKTRKWIGTSDLWVAFVFRGIPAELVDFDLRKQPQVKASDLVINWVINYFTPKQAQEKPTNAFEFLKVSPVISTDKMPLILQHDGHSRTVVGYEVDKNGLTSLLVFDPSHKPSSEIRNAAIAEYSLARQDSSSALNQGTSGQDTSGSLKRKRSGTLSSTQEKAGKQSSHKPPSPLKNGLSLENTSREGKEPDFYTMVKKFRLEPKNLSKKKEYQILYFPMTAPLTDYERMQRKEVRSTKIS
ncbi:hypothetical protein GALMADRAFT_239342 [Galerina marginata CBS 339.88]|uniref:UFSP1/2/DUB catalytic domain-containing protein n=1 Tax=Galerina marginata (strain CBS 339.88) TaxID=685588 RepID=A0A067TR89_GALM3|nr:hypothetical protein GALMADRAFT_239342 [Galerina marginata CBS 339.88]